MRRPFFVLSAAHNAAELESRQPIQPAYNLFTVFPVTACLEIPLAVPGQKPAPTPFLTTKIHFCSCSPLLS
jgi:hypothetical protein